MAKASKKHCWVVEARPAGMKTWFTCGAYHTEDEARFWADKAIKDTAGTGHQYRYRNAFPIKE